MKRVLLVVLVGVLVGAVGAAPVRTAPDLSAGPEKRCRIVLKKIKGQKQKKRVRVCKKPKKRPQPPPPPAAPPIVQPAGLAKIALGSQAESITAGLGSVWVAAGQAILRIDPTTNEVVRRYELPFEDCFRPAVGAGAFWTQQCGTDDAGALRIDIASGAVTTLASVRGAFAFGAGSLWALSGDGRMLRMDPVTAALQAEIRVGSEHGTATYDFGSVWVTDNFIGSLIRIDPGTNAVAATIPVGDGFRSESLSGPEVVTTGAGAAWVTNATESALYRVDPAANTSTRLTNVSPQDGNVEFALGGVWIRWGGDTIGRVDPGTNRVTARYRTGPSPGTFAGGFGSIWVANGAELWRITP